MPLARRLRRATTGAGIVDQGDDSVAPLTIAQYAQGWSDPLRSSWSAIPAFEHA